MKRSGKSLVALACHGKTAKGQRYKNKNGKQRTQPSSPFNGVTLIVDGAGGEGLPRFLVIYFDDEFQLMKIV